MDVSFDRERTKGDEENVFIKSKTHFKGLVEFPDVTGPLWNFFYISLQNGSFSWKTMEGEVRPKAKNFLLYLPVNCLCHDLYEDAEVELAGLYSKSESNLGSRVFVIELTNEDAPKDYKELLALTQHKGERQFVDYNAAPEKLALEIKSVIDNEFCEGIEISTVSEKLNKAAATVSRSFKKSFGMAPKAYLNLVRINYAEFLFGIDKEINDVIFDVGFKDFSRFYKVFKTKMKETPKGIKVLIKE